MVGKLLKYWTTQSSFVIIVYILEIDAEVIFSSYLKGFSVQQYIESNYFAITVYKITE